MTMHNPEKPKKWQFNATVAQNFEDEAQKNIPDYDRVIQKCLQIAQKLYPKDAKIIDIGCAIGETLKQFYNIGYTNLFGTDSSPHMLERAYKSQKDKIHYIHSETFPKHLAPFDMITANWVLHFIKDREAYLKDMFDSLSQNGCLIVTDKLTQSSLVDSLYRDFKLEQGLSQEYIAYKDEALKDVLITYPLDWYLQTFAKIGFRSVEIINANYSFATFLLKKS